MIFIIDQDDRIQYVNSYAAAFLNLPLEEIIGQPRERFFPSQANGHQQKHILKVLKQGKTSYAESFTKLNDKPFWMGTWLVPLRDASGNISSVMGVASNISRRKRAEIQVRRSRDLLEKRVEQRTVELAASQNQLRQLTSQLVTSLEEERRRISRELHDEAGQELISLKYGLASIEGDIHKDRAIARERLNGSMEIIDRIMLQIRTLTHSLRPPALEIMGINLCLKDYCNEIAEQRGLLVGYQGEEVPNLPDAISISLYRFAQEALTNISKHAHATRVEVRLQYRKGQVALTVSDNGCGMESSGRSDGIGLIGIEERLNLMGGTLKIHSSKNKGLEVTASLPWLAETIKDQEE
jgi:PAS domain S-box-containing protein